MKGFIVYSTYHTIDNKAYIYLYGRLENNQNFLTINHYKPYFFIKKSDLKKALNLEKFEYSLTNLKNFNYEDVVKVTLDIPPNVPLLRKLFEENDILCYEADIRFTSRFLIDLNIKGSLNIEGDYTSNDFINRIYKEPELYPINYKPNLKIFSIDIETSSDAKKLYCLSIYSENFQKSLIISNKKLKNALSFKNESLLLEKFKQIILEEDPDIITGWNVIDFDLKYLQERFRKNKIPFNFGRENKPIKIKLESDFFRESKIDIAGRQILDGLNLLRSSFVKVNDYKLETVAFQFLGKKKLISKENKGDEIERLYKQDQEKLIDYNLNDAKLAYEIIHSTKILDLTIQRSLLTGMSLNRVTSSIASLDFLYLHESRKNNLVCPSSVYLEKTKPITGGFVMESKPGIYDYILLLDFKSLYPSIIRTFNIDPSSYLEYYEKGAIKAPNEAYFKNKDGILPSVIQELLQHRESARKEKNELARYAIKILANSFFGVLANPNCRFFNPKIANAITHFGQYIVKLTAKKIQEQGYDVIYSDTDSVFVISNAKSYEEALKIGDHLQKNLNEFYKNFILKEYKRISFLELEFDKCFIRFLMPKIRSGEKGAKKRYAGLIKKDSKEEILTTGIEYSRSDWTDAAQKFQIELLDKVFHKQEPSSFIKKFVNDIKDGKYDDLLVYRKQLRKGLDGYTVNPPHLKAARKLSSLISNIIEYVITIDGPEPIQNQKHKIDYDHYINKQIKPIANMVLSFFNLTFDDIIQGSKQTKLFGY